MKIEDLNIFDNVYQINKEYVR